jgi:HK97 family phage major capsid protein
MPFPALKEAEDKLAAVNKKMATAFDEAGADMDFTKVKSIDGDNLAKIKQIQAWNQEATDLGIERDGLLAVDAAAQRTKRAKDAGEPDPSGEPGAPDAKDSSRKDDEPVDFGKLFVDSVAYKGRVRGGQGPQTEIKGIEVKTLMTTAGGWAPQNIRTGRVVDFATRPIQVVDMIPANTTSQAAIVYMEETTFTNSAAEVAEGGTYAESALALTERTSPVRKVGTFLPMTDEQLEDIDQARGYVNNRLPFMLRQRMDAQILVGSGTPPALTGFLNTSGIQTQAKGADPSPDAIYKAMTKIRVTGRAIPDAVIYHPTNWQDVRLLRTADGIYIWGSPMEAGPERIWGIPVIQADSITLGTALVGAFQQFTELATRRGIDVQISNSHSTFFIEGKQAVRADTRVALTVYRPAALCTVTGL